MSDFTINDTMAEIRYELDDREIYNDIRSEIGILITETVIDADPTYSWSHWLRTYTIPPDGLGWIFRFEASRKAAFSWQISNVSAKDQDGNAYYAYKTRIITTDSSWIIWIEVTNTGSKTMTITLKVKYKYKTADQVTHEEQIPGTLTVRAIDADSIAKYGRRVMNLTWTEGTGEGEMQILVNHYVDRYKEPVARLSCILKGSTDILRTQIITREISDLITVICTNLGLNADCFINSISMRDSKETLPFRIPVCTWGLEIQRAYELLTYWVWDTSWWDGGHYWAP